MTTAIVLCCSICLAGMIGMVEYWRGHIRGQLDFLRAANVVYLMCFGIAPAYLQFADPRVLRQMLWGWTLRTPFTDEVFALASILSLGGYPFLLLGYRLVAARRPRALPAAPLAGPGYLWVAGLGIGVVGLVSLVTYAMSVGGWGVFIFEALAFRGNDPPVVSRVAFLTNTAPLVIGAVLVFFALRQYHARGLVRLIATLCCALFFGASLVILFHQAGRAAFVAFLVLLPLTVAVQRNRLTWTQVLLGTSIFFVLVVFGRVFFQAARDPGLLLRSASGLENIGETLRSVVLEFSFPIVTLANAIRNLPEVTPLRWFVDFPLAVEYLIPQRITGLVHAPTVSMVNTALFQGTGGIPVDVLSLGYYSALLPGAVLTVTALGAVIGAGERWLPASPDPLRAGLRVAWLMVIALRIMYADPQLFWRSGLYLLITTGVVLLPAVLRKMLPAMPHRPVLAAAAGAEAVHLLPGEGAR